jgi:hypothetical protein
MMEGVYGRGVSAIEVLRGWEPSPPQFKALSSALQVLMSICNMRHLVWSGRAA